MINIVIDMMGGDKGVKATIPAVSSFANLNLDCTLFCVGNEEDLEQLKSINNVKIIPSKTLIKMDADPMSALKDLDSSLMVGVNLLIKNDYDAIISAGSTGALLSAAVFKIKRIEGIKRPALITDLPTILGDKKVSVLDLGANTESSAEELSQFAKLGSIYYSLAHKVACPKVFALNIGTEEEKGRDINKEAFKLMKEDNSISFEGNIEGRDVLLGSADVVVCDGYSGNIFLKSTEGAIKAMSSLLKDAFKKNLMTKLSYLSLKGPMKEMKKKMDYKSVGGAMLLGVNKLVVKAHGSSDENAFVSALNLTKTLVEQDIINKIKGEFKK